MGIDIERNSLWRIRAGDDPTALHSPNGTKPESNARVALDDVVLESKNAEKDAIRKPVRRRLPAMERKDPSAQYNLTKFPKATSSHGAIGD
jgi:hypothetical protein